VKFTKAMPWEWTGSPAAVGPAGRVHCTRPSRVRPEPTAPSSHEDGGRRLLDDYFLYLDACLGAVSLDRRLADLVDDVHPLDDLAEDRELAREGGLIGQADEELVPEGRRTAATEPRVIGRSENSAFSSPSPPVP
jgi:hypothetical protein